MLRYFAIALVAFCLVELFVETSYGEPSDPCKEKGIVVRNATMLDLWYKKNDGVCTIWIHEHLLTIKRAESIKIFSDMNCQTLYCRNNPTYDDYKSADKDGDCFVNVFPICRISDK